MSNIQRALWTVLFFTLVGPLLAALVTVFAVPVFLGAQFIPPDGDIWTGLQSLNEQAIRNIVALAAFTSLKVYLWAVIPGAVTGLALAFLAARRRFVSRAVVGAFGVIGFMIAVILMPFEHGDLLTFLAFGAGFTAIACHAVLLRIGILMPANSLSLSERTA